MNMYLYFMKIMSKKTQKGKRKNLITEKKKEKGRGSVYGIQAK